LRQVACTKTNSPKYKEKYFLFEGGLRVITDILSIFAGGKIYFILL